MMWSEKEQSVKQQYRVRAVKVFCPRLGGPAEVPGEILMVLNSLPCLTPFVPEILAALNQLGFDARREQEPCPPDRVGIWVTVYGEPMLLQCELEALGLH